MSLAMEHSGFPSDETLAAFIDGRVDPGTRARVIEHLTDCSECYSVFVGATEMPVADGAERERVDPFRRARISVAVGSIAAAAAIGFLVTPAGQRLYRPDSVAALAAVAPAARTFDGRLSGFPYRPPARVLRGPESDPAHDPANWKLLGMAAKVQERAAASRSVENLRALGVSQLLLGDADEAVRTMSEGLEMESGLAGLGPAIEASDDAMFLSDLSAALASRAARSRLAADFALAARAADRAWTIKPSPEAAWNRAVAAELLRGRAAAASAWRDYLAVDSTSEWAGEVRRRLGQG